MSTRDQVRAERLRRFKEEQVKQDKIDAFNGAVRRGEVGEAMCSIGVTPQHMRLNNGNGARFPRVDHGLRVSGRWDVEHVGVDGMVKNAYSFHNNITDEGMNHMLNSWAGSIAKSTTRYGSLIDNAGLTNLLDTDLYDDIDQAGNGWDEFQDYTDGNNGASAVTRPLWDPVDSTAKSMSNSVVQMIFDITAIGVVHGLFIASGPESQTKGDHTNGNILFSHSQWAGGNVSVSVSEQIRATYTLLIAHS